MVSPGTSIEPRRKRLSSCAWYGSIVVMTWVETTCGLIRSATLQAQPVEHDIAGFDARRPG